MRLLAVSVTYTVPAESTVIPYGTLNVAFVPVPSVDPDVLPTNVVTTPPVSILRIRLLSASATYIVPAKSNATPVGFRKLALVPIPSVDPNVLDKLPAKVVTNGKFTVPLANGRVRPLEGFNVTLGNEVSINDRLGAVNWNVRGLDCVVTITSSSK
jgi:hypothetical protein